MAVLPRPKAVKELFEGMLDREVEVRPTNPPRAADLGRIAVAVYVDRSMKLSAVAGLDLVLAATVGAAIGLVPRGGAAACVAERTLSPRIAANLTQACETIGTLLVPAGEAPPRLYQMVLPGDKLAPDASGRLLALGHRLDLEVHVAGYDTGRLSLSV